MPGTYTFARLSKIAKVTYRNLILCGVLISQQTPTLITLPLWSLPSLQTLLHQEELFNVWCCLRNSEINYTYFSARHNTYTHIDMFLVDKWILQRVSWFNHAPIITVVTEKDACASSTVWHCNIKCIQYPSNTHMLSQHLQECSNSMHPQSLIHFLFGIPIRHLFKGFSAN